MEVKRSISAWWQERLELLRQGNITQRLLLFTAGGIILVTIALTTLFVVRMQHVAIMEENRRFYDHYANFLNSIEAQGRTALALALTITQDTAVQQAFSAGDRATLTRLVLPTFLALENKLGVTQGHFYRPPATSFLRLHALDQYGDTLPASRLLALAVNAQKIPQSGLEESSTGWAIFGAAPIWSGAQQKGHLGSVEIGIEFGEDFLQQYVEDYDLDVAVYLLSSDNSGLEPYANTRESALPIPETAYELVLDSQQATLNRISHEGHAYGVLIGPLLNYSGELIGVVELSSRRDQVVKNITIGRNAALLIGGGMTGLVLALLFWQIEHVLSPLSAMRAGAERAADGDLRQTLPIERQDEIGVLTESFNQMISSLNSVLEQIMGATEHLAAASEELAAMMEQLRTGSREITATIGHLSTGAERQVRRAEEASHAAADLTMATEQIAGNAISSGAAATQTYQAVEIAGETTEKLAAKLREIDQVVTLVSKIATKTNLISLNASIEAARAGELGAGFGVVAEEIRRLAQHSSSSVEKIAKLSREIGNRLGLVQGKMEETEKSVLQASWLAQQTSAAASAQTETTAAVVEAINEMATVAENSAVATEQISRTVNEQLAAIEQVATAVGSLAEVANQLQVTAARFKVRRE